MKPGEITPVPEWRSPEETLKHAANHLNEVRELLKINIHSKKLRTALDEAINVLGDISGVSKNWVYIGDERNE